MATSSLFTSKLLNLRNSALHSLIRRHLLHSTAAAASKNTLPFTSNQFLLKSGGAKSQIISSNAYLHSSIRFGAARSYATAKGDRHNDADSDGAEGSDDEIDFDDLESFNGSEFDDEDEYEDSDDDPDAK